MKRLSIILSLVILPIAPVHSVTKRLTTYDPHTDCVVNETRNNPVYGDRDRSYSDRHRRPPAKVRVKRFYASDIEGKTVMDFGCNEGDVLMAAIDAGATHGIGVEYNHMALERGINSRGDRDIKFFPADLENQAIYHFLPQVDTVFILAVLDTSTFANKEAVIANVSRKAKHALYYEGHMTDETHVKRMHEFMQFSDFTRFEYLGRNERRLLMRCSKETITPDQVPEGAITTSSPERDQLGAEAIYILPNSNKNPCFSARCHLIQYVQPASNP